jgi:transitional endoplasmic reticulum ATPase
LFPDPNEKERTAYCKFWQKKLSDNKDIDFPDELCGAIAKITDKFSFAYMQEAFVAALLALARRATDTTAHSDDTVEDMDEGWVGIAPTRRSGLDDNVLWNEIQKQIEILREGMENDE